MGGDLVEHFEIRDLSFSYAGADAKALDGVSLTVNRGEFVVFCGRSGCGKTTLLRHLKTVLAPHGKREGEILFCGVPLDEVSEAEQAAKIGFVMQDPDDQIVTDKVWHELAFGPESLGWDQKRMRAAVAEMACYFGIQDWFRRDVAQLSGGEKQLLSLASVMVMHPEVLILDEPTSQLDPVAASDFLSTVRKINVELGTTVLISEHRLEDVFPYADRAVVMDGGKITAADGPRNVGRILYEKNDPMFSAMSSPVRAFFGSQPEGECPLTVREGRAWLGRSVPDGAKMPDEQAAEKEEAGAAALKFKEVWFRYEKDGKDVLRGVDAVIPEGCFFAIVGGNGAGKSTFLKTACRVLRPYRGKIEIFGKDAGKYKSGELFNGCIAMLPQDPKCLFVKKTVAAELEEMSGDAARRDEIAGLCEITHLLDRHPYDLSCGEEQRVALAKVLLTDPRLILLDEPTKGMDSSFKESLAALISSLKERGITVVAVSHDVEFCARYADLVGMFFDGQILTADTPRRFFGGNSFYTTAANRMSRGILNGAVTVEDIVGLYKTNRERKL